MSEEAHKHEKDEELEALLKKLVPGPLHFDLLAELNRDRERIHEERTIEHAGVRWRRLIPLSVVSAVLMAGFGYVQFGGRFSDNDDLPVERANVVAAPAAAAAPATEPQFLPVSSHGYLLNTSSGGVIQTEEGPRERLNLEYEDAYHWHDPASGTNIRFFQPRSEEVIVPLRTD